MAGGKAKRWAIIGIVLLLVLLVGGIFAFRAAVGILKGKVVEALGPGSEIRELRVGWSAVEVEGLRITGGPGWPAADALRAERVIIVPSLRSLLTGEVRVRSITVVKPYLSALRTREGKLLVVPSLLERPAKPQAPGAAAPGAPAQAVAISRITLRDGAVELFDATVAKPPLKIRLEQVQASVEDVVAPTLTGKSPFSISGVIKGVKQDGRGTASGWADVATKDSSVKLELRSVDLVAFQPYLAKAGDVRLDKGALDLNLDSQVRQNHLRAPGRAVISDLQFAPGGGPLGTFMGVPQGAVVTYLKDKSNKIDVPFVIEGDINNPRFSLNEFFATRVAEAVAGTLGVSFKELPQRLEGVGLKALEETGKTGKAPEGALKELKGIFGGEKKK
ncbi:MAG: DUF748 domain-containing protein [candidate division NC10 bacterium]|nr:DUF748 domain-containing protein [candidate division NC10 bacterium]